MSRGVPTVLVVVPARGLPIVPFPKIQLRVVQNIKELAAELKAVLVGQRELLEQ
jgi:hypothetical protein